MERRWAGRRGNRCGEARISAGSQVPAVLLAPSGAASCVSGMRGLGLPRPPTRCRPVRAVRGLGNRERSAGEAKPTVLFLFSSRDPAGARHLQVREVTPRTQRNDHGLSTGQVPKARLRAAAEASQNVVTLSGRGAETFAAPQTPQPEANYRGAAILMSHDCLRKKPA